jgi:hypothetical protein
MQTKGLPLGQLGLHEGGSLFFSFQPPLNYGGQLFM